MPPGTFAFTETPGGGLCEATDLTVRLTRGGQLVEEEHFPGTCSGPCTEKEQEAARREVAELVARYEAGEIELSELDYDYTTCYSFSSAVDQELQLDGRPGLLLSHTYAQPHTGTGTRYQVLLDVCGGLFESKEFGARYGNSWERIALDRTGPRLTATGHSGGHSAVVYRLDTSRCPPAEEVIDAL